MKTTLYTLATVVALTLTSFAVDRTITALDGTQYEKAEVTKVEPDGITVSYDAGIAKIPFAKLPPELQKEFNYDATKAAGYSQAAAQAQAALRQAQAREVAAIQANKTPEVSQQDQLENQRKEALYEVRAKELAVAAFKNWQRNVSSPGQGVQIGNKVFLESQAPRMSDLVESFKAQLRAGKIK